MKKTSLAFFLIYAGATFADSNLDRGVAMYSARHFAECSNYFSGLTKSSPENALYWFNYGNCAYMAGDYATANKAHRHAAGMKTKLAPAARYYAAKSLIALGQREPAITEMERVLASAPPGLSGAIRADLRDARENEAKEYAALDDYQAGRYADAEKKLRDVPDDSRSADARALLGMVLLKQGRSQAAARVFEDVVKLPMDSEKRSQTRALLSRARHGETESLPYWLYLDGALGWTNNAYVDGRSISPVSSPLIQGSLGAGYHFLQGRPTSVKIGYIMNFEEPTNATVLTTLTHTLQAPLIHRDPDFELTAIPFFQDQNWNGSEVSQRTGVLTRVSTMKDRYELGGEVELDNQHSTSSQNSYLEGTSYYAKPFLAFWGSVTYFQVYWMFGKDGTHDIVYSDRSVLPLEQHFQGPGGKMIWRLDEVTAIYFNLAFLQRGYENASQPGAKSRNDRQVAASFKCSRFVQPKLAVYGAVDYVNNQSTLGANDVRDKNYETYTLTAGVAWDAFR